ncbi:unknown [Tropheryma whipplei str. Twist]|uniref:Uncharacterized protein n=1 Tax=Tropheryma whipplei (strain Twist) TaxID=203267 RepID=Q83FX6_TROWT|nr:unknown [Tropheryma whipplei str. Twist]
MEDHHTNCHREDSYTTAPGTEAMMKYSAEDIPINTAMAKVITNENRKISVADSTVRAVLSL